MVWCSSSLCPTRPDSSGFEHVFVGETRGGRTVIGFHNWIQLYLQEKLGHIDYKGYSVNANSPQVHCCWVYPAFLHHTSIYICLPCLLSSYLFPKAPCNLCNLPTLIFLAQWWETSHPVMTKFSLSPPAQLSVFCLSNPSLILMLFTVVVQVVLGYL